MENSLQTNNGSYYILYVLSIFAIFGHIYTLVPGSYYIITYGFVTVLSLAIIFGSKSWIMWEYPQMKIMWGLFFWSAFLILLTPLNPFLTLRSSMVFFLHFPIIIATIQLIDNIEKLKTLTFVISLALIFFAFNAFSSFDGTYFPGLDSLWNPNGVSMIFCALLPFAYVMVPHEKKSLKKYCYILATIMAVSIIIMTKSRTGFVILLVYGSLYWTRSSHKILLGFVLGGTLLVGGIIVGQEYIEEMSTSTDVSTTGSRFTMWEYTISEIFSKNPLGVGINNTTRIINDQTGHGGGSHSLYLTFLGDLGIVGVLLFLGLAFMNLRYSWNISKVNTDNVIGAFAFANFTMVVGFLVVGIMEAPNYDIFFWISTAFIVATYRIFQKENRR